MADKTIALGSAHTLEEKHLHQAWQQVGMGALTLEADDGFCYTVKYAGRYSPRVGPDFKDAVLQRADQKLIAGDIELHVDEDDWFNHKHHLDRRYNAVVLHIVFKFGKKRARTTDGRQPPCAMLNLNHLAKLKSGGGARKLSLNTVSTAGDERFINRASGFMLEIKTVGAEQALYSGIMECLGYSHNKIGFIRLATRLKWAVLEKLNDTVVVRALLWAAGFTTRPQGICNLDSQKPRWNKVAGRPVNHPRNRIKASAALFIAMKNAGGPVLYCEHALLEARNSRALLANFTLSHAQSPQSLGKGRASAIIINTVLPFMFAWSEMRGEHRLSGVIRQIYREYPALPANSVLSEATQIFNISDLTNGRLRAREQQGLLHLYRLFSMQLARQHQLNLD